MSARIVFHRGDGWVDRWRAYEMIVSGQSVGRIKRNDVLCVEVAATQHVLMAWIDWCGSNMLFVDASDGDEVHVEVSNPHSIWTAMRFIRRDPGNYLLLEQRTPFGSEQQR